VTDADLKDLAGFKELDWLNLNDTEVTDAGIKDRSLDSEPIALPSRVNHWVLLLQQRHNLSASDAS
jgi:hypothetical protein